MYYMKEKISRWLFLLLLLLTTTGVYAYDIGSGDITFSSAYDKTNGFFDIVIPIYDDAGADEGMHTNASSYVKVKCNGREYTLCNMYSFPGAGDPQPDGGSYWVKVKKSVGSDILARMEVLPTNGSGVEVTSTTNYTQVSSPKSGSKSKVTLRFYLGTTVLQTSSTFEVYLRIDKNNAGDYDVRSTSTSIGALTFPDPSISGPTTGNAGKQNFRATVSNYSGTAYLSATDFGEQQTTDRTFEYSVGNAAQSKEISAIYKFNYNRAVTKKKTVTVDQYQAVSNLKAVSDKNGATALSWTIPNADASGNILDAGNFLLEKRIETTSGSWTSWTTAQELSNDARSYVDYETQLTPKKIEYRISRTKPWTGYAYQTTTIDKSGMTHAKVTNFTYARLLTQRQIELCWEWDYDKNSNQNVVLTDGSKFVITREVSVDGETFTQDEVIEVPCEELVDNVGTCTYLTSIPQSCVLYRWKIHLEPGKTGDYYKAGSDIFASKYQIAMKDENGEVMTDEHGNVQYEDNTDGINDAEIASLEYFRASHGYYGDRVELDWKLDDNSGSLNVFSVQRRVYGEEDTDLNPFVQIGTVEATEGIVHYSYIDNRAVPGTVYEYMIEGSKECANEEVKTHDYTYGFCTATGNVYGRITYDNESGQAVNGAEVRLETTANITGKSYVFNKDYFLQVDKQNFSDETTDSLSLQLFVKFDENPSSKVSLLKKEGMYELYAENNKLHFDVGGQVLQSDRSIEDLSKVNSFIQLTAVLSKDSLFMYSDSTLLVRAVRTIGKLPASAGNFTMGSGLSGNLDEVRVWNKALTKKDVQSTYDRYLAGDEDGLIAYWTFNHSTAKEFYDFAHKDSEFYMNDGKIRSISNPDLLVENAELSNDPADNPSPNQLSYKDYTDSDGSYYIAGIPYLGNGTLYQVIPRLGTHEFSPTKTQVTLSAGSVNHAANFIDQSSFPVSGTITYKGGTIPVEGVSFYVDGVVCTDSKKNIITSDALGHFKISVPVGTHEVRASMSNHKFLNDGRITDSYGNDINYQDDRYSTVKITDITTVRYIGRVAGGTIQEAYPVGHSLSTNNLAEGVSVQLTYDNAAYKLYNSDKDSIADMTHFLPGNWADQGKKANTNKVRFRNNVVTITPHPETGEFIADLPPLDYTVKLNVPGYDNISGDNSQLSLKNAFAQQNETHEYVDSMQVKNEWVKKQYNDTVTYNWMQKFIARVKPTIGVEQMQGNQVLPYFGDAKTSSLGLDGTKEVALYDEESKTYALGLPMFSQANPYKLKASVFEEYFYYDESGQKVEDHPSDRVPSQDAVVSFQTTMSSSNATESVTADSTGVAYWTFMANKVDLTSANANINITATVGNEDNATSIAWVSPFDENNKVLTKGSVSQGNNFITAGPDKLLAVLRDPPGSNSYSYLERGTTFTESSNYTGGITQDGENVVEVNVGTELITFTGIGAGTIQSVVANNQATVNIDHTEEWMNSETKTSTTTISSTFSTSDMEDYVGAMADLFIGYSTNLSYGTADVITLIDKDKYDANPSAYTLTYPTTGNGKYVLAQTTSLEAGTKFSTMFAYTQHYIEKYLLPEMKSLRNSFLHQPTEMSPERFQAEANATKQPIYVSKLLPEDENYAKSNIDPVFEEDPLYYTKDGNSVFDGPSYKIYFPSDIEVKSDTINYLNQSIANWIARLADNEKAKVDAIAGGNVLQNYSLQAGSNIEYSKGFSNVNNTTNEFTFVLGSGIGTEIELAALGSGSVINIQEKLSTTQGGAVETEEEANTTVGFVLSDTGNDYFTVDVYNELDDNKDVGYEDIADKDLNLSTFIFYTRAGATSCPYEDEVVTKWYEPGEHVLSEATLQIEVPEIAVEKAFIENVPSGESAYLTLYLRNNSAIQEDGWFNLVIDDQSNPNGAGLKMDGAAIGNGRTLLVPAGETLVKTLEVTKGSEMNYDNLRLVLASQCQGDPTANFPAIADTVTFSVHFTPSCSDVKLAAPSNNWTYNTELPTEIIKQDTVHYMNVQITDFNVNYDNFKAIRLMYKPSSASDDNWTTLMNYFADQKYYDEAVNNGLNAEMIKSEDQGTINYKWYLDDMPDQSYDLCAVSVCNINNVEVENFSEIHTGIKDMYCPRPFGTPQPANGILTIEDEAKITFNEAIAAGYLTENNFEVTGIKNGTPTDHSVAVEMDGNDTFVSELNRSFRAKDITFEAWVNLPHDQNATFFEHSAEGDTLSFGITEQRQLKAIVNGKSYTSDVITTDNFLDNWVHVAMVLDQNEDGASTGSLSLYCNYVSYLNVDEVPAYTASSTYTIAKNLVGKIHNVRIWTAARTSGQIQTQSNELLSGNEENLLSYYPMDEARGTVLEDKARGLNLAMTGGTWILPEGRSLVLNGSNSYLKLNSGSSVALDLDNDYTIELWFKGDGSNSNSTLLASGKADGTDWGGSENLFFLGFENGALTYRTNNKVLTGNGNYLDDNWHHVAVAVNRMTDRAQLYVDGSLVTYTSATGYGRIASSYIYAGVTPVAINGLNNTYVDYFNGTLDDIRFWNLYKNEKSVKAGMSNRLDGSEMGLLSYYPFEKHTIYNGIPEVQFSLADDKVPASTGTSNSDAVAVIGEMEFPEINTANRVTVEDAFMTSAIAPVKDKGGVVDLLFDYVVNDDALIITLKEDAAKIEKTTVTFTVSDVRDLNGNSIASPITWTAYIDRNQLKWGENELTLVKNVDEPLTFSVEVVNNGGYTKDYTISNYPSWMSVEPSSGTLTATAKKEIKFTVDESLNIGTYNEVIYLTNDEGVSEPLNITLKVNGNRPDWSVNPADYKYSMNVYGAMKINGRYSNDLEDVLAVFEDNVCVGVANNEYIKVNDTYYALLTVYSNVGSHKNLNFKMWDASTGTTYIASPEYPINFEADKIIGTSVDPVEFTNLDMVQLDIPLNDGWTWTSFNVSNESMTQMSDVLQYNQWATGDEVKREDGGVATYGTETGWQGSLNSFDNTGMFLIRSSYPQTLSVIGEPVDVASHVLTINSVNSKGVAIWNYIPYLSQVNLPLNEALAGYEALEGDVIKSQSGFAMYNGNLGWIGSLTYMQPGYGYMLQRKGTTSATLQYPSSKTQGNKVAPATRSAGSGTAMVDMGYANTNYSRTMSMVATVDGVQVEEGDVLKVYVDGELRGESPLICKGESDEPLFFLSIAGEQKENVDMAVERNGEVIAAVTSAATFQADKIEGSYSNPRVISFIEDNMMVYPSPFVNELYIKKQVDEKADVKVTITDMKGAVVALFENCNKQGKVDIHWTGAASCAPGVYIVNIVENGENHVYKVIKIKN